MLRQLAPRVAPVVARGISRSFTNAPQANHQRPSGYLKPILNSLVSRITDALSPYLPKEHRLSAEVSAEQLHEISRLRAASAQQEAALQAEITRLETAIAAALQEKNAAQASNAEIASSMQAQSTEHQKRLAAIRTGLVAAQSEARAFAEESTRTAAQEAALQGRIVELEQSIATAQQERSAELKAMQVELAASQEVEKAASEQGVFTAAQETVFQSDISQMEESIEVLLREKDVTYQAELAAMQEALKAAQAAQANLAEKHPDLPAAQLVYDFHYKRVYAASVRDLVALPVWERQRAYREERAKAIAAAFTRGQVPCGPPVRLPGSIVLFENPAGRLAIVDGQHRVGAMRQMAEDGLMSRDAPTVLVEVVPVTSDDEASTLFREINSAEPVREIDMPGSAPAEEARSIIDAAIEHLARQHAEMFKPSAKCRPPHINVDVLRDDLYSEGVIKRHGITNAAGMLAFLEARNTSLANQKKWAGHGANSKAVAKAKKHDFWLGLDKNWLREASVDGIST